MRPVIEDANNNILSYRHLVCQRGRDNDLCHVILVGEIHHNDKCPPEGLHNCLQRLGVFTTNTRTDVRLIVEMDVMQEDEDIRALLSHRMHNQPLDHVPRRGQEMVQCFAMSGGGGLGQSHIHASPVDVRGDRFKAAFLHTREQLTLPDLLALLRHASPHP